MNLFVAYESAVYNADVAEENVKDEKYGPAMEHITKCYKNIDNTDLIIETNARVYTEKSVKAIQNENKDEAIHQLKKLKTTISQQQESLLKKPME